MPKFIPRTKNFVMPELIDRFPPVGNPPDGYVITYSSSDGYYYPQATSKRQINSSPSSSPYNVGSEDVVLVQSHVGTFTVNLPIAPAIGTHLYIKDFAGVAAANVINVASGANIDGGSPYAINTNYGCIHVVFNGATWSILSKF